MAQERRLQVASSDVSGSVAALARSLRFGLQAAMLGVGGYLVIGNEMSGGGIIIAAAVVLARGLSPFEQLIGTWGAFVATRTARRRLRGLLSRVAHEAARLSLPRPAGPLAVEGVCYLPPGAREPTLRDVSLRLEGGEVLGVLGPSGAGKSTLARLLVGSFVPTVGHVRLDGAEMSAWQGPHLGYMPQGVDLFAATVRGNIARLQHAPDDQVVAAARLAGAHDMILRLPAGYDTPLGDRGVALSGGQRPARRPVAGGVRRPGLAGARRAECPSRRRRGIRPAGDGEAAAPAGRHGRVGEPAPGHPAAGGQGAGAASRFGGALRARCRHAPGIASGGPAGRAAE